MKELAQSHVTVETKFNYVQGLVKSPNHEHGNRGSAEMRRNGAATRKGNTSASWHMRFHKSHSNP